MIAGLCLWDTADPTSWFIYHMIKVHAMADTKKVNPPDLVNAQRFVDLANGVLDASVKFRTGPEYNKARMLADRLLEAASIKAGVPAPSD